MVSKRKHLDVARFFIEENFKSKRTGRNPGEKWTPLVGHISSFLKWLTQLMLRIFAYRSRPHQE
jgi:hypothetical protein